MIADKRKYKNDEIFHEICKTISLKKHDTNMNNVILKSFILDKLIPVLKKSDDDFAKIFKSVMFCGSYYKDLKISKPDEFDLNLIIKLPIDYDAIQIDTNHNYHGYIKIKVDKKFLNDKNGNLWSDLLDENYYIDQNKFRSWIQSVFDKALSKFKRPSGYVIKSNKKSYHIKYDQNNPAFTLHVEIHNGTTITNVIDFDLVPCLKFDDKYLHEFMSQNTESFTTIAKPINESQTDYNLLWRPSFYESEKELLKGQIKPIIRAVKKLRDEENWMNLKSYHIETLFLHELNNKSFSEEYPHVSRTSVLMHALKKLEQKLRVQELFNFWCPKNNLLSGKDDKHFESVIIRLRNIIDHIEKDPKNLRYYFGLSNGNQQKLDLH